MKHKGSRAWWPLGLAALLALLFFGPVLVRGEIYYVGDTVRQYLPQYTLLHQALAERSLPWWTSKLGAGYPLLAEGEVGAFYPLNYLLLLRLPFAMPSLLTVLHYLLMGVGFYIYARRLRLARVAACLGALVWSLGGFNIAHLSHVAILGVATWLPWMLALTQFLLGEYKERTSYWNALLLALVVAIQFYAGHAQISLLGLLALGFYGLYLVCSPRLHASPTPNPGWQPRLMWLGALLLGALLALPQLGPAWELAAHSQRAGGLESTFLTSFSFHPFLFATYFSPFVLGNPYPQGSVELMGYVGLLPLFLASVALWRSPRREKWFFLALGMVGAALALGRWNPLYRLLEHIPLLNLFRVPARYLFWCSLALAALAAFGIDTLIGSVTACTTIRHEPSAELAVTLHRRALGLLAVVGMLLAIALLVVVRAPNVAALITAWRWLPLLFLGASGAWLLSGGVLAGTLRRQPNALWPMPAVLWASLALALGIVDLYAYAAVLAHTYNATTPRAVVQQQPASLAFFTQEQGLYRLYTKEEIVPALTVMRESYYPNLAVTYGLASANLYMPLVPRVYADYLQGLNAERLNRLNVRYYLIPQLLPVDAQSELYDVQDPLAALPVNKWLEIEPTPVTELEVESYLSHAVDLNDGAPAAELVLRSVDGVETALPLRVGLETAEWAYERDDVRQVISHSMPTVASTWPARSGFPPREHVGHTYQARVKLASPLRLQAVLLRLARPEAFVRVERVRLYDAAGHVQLLAHLLGLGDHQIAYRSEDVLIYRNADALPRAYTLPTAVVQQENYEVRLPTHLVAAEVGPVEVLDYSDRQVTLRVQLATPGYLILADMDYPGWQAAVDGKPAPILRADGLFRALSLSAGTHAVTFTYQPLLH